METENHPRLFLSLIRGKLSQFRDQGIATLSLTATLILVFQFEVLYSGDNSVYSTLNSIPEVQRTIIAFTLAPFLHQGYEHLVDNLGLLLLLGFYLERYYNRETIYAFFFLIGYSAAWLTILSAPPGAVGASGVTYGLTAWLFIQAGYNSINEALQGDIVHGLFHTIPALYGISGLITITGTFLSASQINAQLLVHFLGALLGTLVGILFLYQIHLGQDTQNHESV